MTDTAPVRAASPLEGLDPSRNLIVSAFGTKGSGKTSVCRVIFDSYPWAKLCVDVNGDAGPAGDLPIIRAPRRSMPVHEQGEPWPALHYIADPGSATYREDLDDAVGMAMEPKDQPCLVWCDEVGEFTTGNKTGPHLRRLLMQSRHYRTSALFSGPRPVDIDKLVIIQSDLIFVFEMPDEADQDRVAKNIGWPVQEFRDACQECWSRGDHCHLIYDKATKTMFDCDPIPL